MFALLSALLVTTALADTPLDGLPAPARERFEAAEGAWSKGELDAADAAFGEVIAAAPGFDRAYRRRCGVRIAQERLDEAVADCEKAAELVKGKENDTALAMALLWDEQPKEARALIDGVLKEDPDYKLARVAQCNWAAQVNDKAALEGCSKVIEQADGASAGALYFKSLAKLSHGDVEGAHEALVAAREQGLTDDLAQGVGTRAQEVAEAKARREQRDAAQRKAEAWTAQDFVPGLVVLGLLVTVGILWYGREDKGAKA